MPEQRSCEPLEKKRKSALHAAQTKRKLRWGKGVRDSFKLI